MENYKKLYPLFLDFDKHIEDLALKNDDVSNSFYLAKNFLSEIFSKAYRDKDICSWFLSYLSGKGSTVLLKDILATTAFNDTDLLHFNAFFLIDTYRCSYNI